MEFVSQVITIFSASNYYEVGSNKGAYVKLVGPQLAPHFVQFTTATPRTKKLTFRQRVGLVESSAIRELSCQIVARRDQLLEEFLKYDQEQTGGEQGGFCLKRATQRNQCFGGIYYLRLQGIKLNYGINKQMSGSVPTKHWAASELHGFITQITISITAVSTFKRLIQGEGFPRVASSPPRSAWTNQKRFSSRSYKGVCPNKSCRIQKTSTVCRRPV
jgi:hypothetical protein